MYAKLNNGVLETYPFTIDTLRKENPNTSFPFEMSPSVLLSFGVVPVVEAQNPPQDHTKIVTESAPTLVDGVWRTTWEVSDASPEIIQERRAEKLKEVREERDQLLANSDWTQLSDCPLSNVAQTAWATYRQALRDLPFQDDPFNIKWPTVNYDN